MKCTHRSAAGGSITFVTATASANPRGCHPYFRRMTNSEEAEENEKDLLQMELYQLSLRDDNSAPSQEEEEEEEEERGCGRSKFSTCAC